MFICIKCVKSINTDRHGPLVHKTLGVRNVTYKYVYDLMYRERKYNKLIERQKFRISQNYVKNMYIWTCVVGLILV